MKNSGIEDPFHNKIDVDLWRRIFKFAMGHPRLLSPLAFSAVALSIIESQFPIATKIAVEIVEKGEPAENLWKPAALFFGLSISLSALVWVFIVCAGSISHNIGHDIKRSCFKRLQELEFAYYDAQPAGWLISRLTADCDRLSRILAWGFLDLVWGLFFVVAMAITMFVLNAQLALLVLSTIAPLIFVSSFFRKRMLITSREIRKHNARITASYNEGIAGVKTTKTLGRESENLGDFESMSQDMYTASVKRALLGAVYLPIVVAIGSIGSGLALWYGGVNVINDTLTLGTVIAFMGYAGQFFFPINQIAMVLAELQGAQAAGERVMGLLATKPKIKDTQDVLNRIENSKAKSNAEIAIDGYANVIERIEFKEVGFRYNAKETVLEGFNLAVKRGETIALVGPSGGGKSTIVSLLSRFYEPTSGSLLINGIDYRQRSLEWLQSQLGIVLQTPHLFNGTIRENIRYGNLQASDREIESVAQIVNGHELIMNLSDGYNTKIGEGGARLSTGERQLISFARALIADPQIFIMDEATSSIDTETEAIIQSSMQRIFEGRISFVIAHRLSTIRSADRILYIEKGRIVESGNHAELMEKRGRYHRLYLKQFRRERFNRELEVG